MSLTKLLIFFPLCWAHGLSASQVPLCTRGYGSEVLKGSCVEYARNVARKAAKDGRVVYFIVGFTNGRRPHVFVVVDGWAIDNGAISPRIFLEDDITKHMRQWWIEDDLPRKAYLRITEDGHQEVYEGN